MRNDGASEEDGLANDFTCDPFSIEDGFQRLKPYGATNFSTDDVRERMNNVMPMDPQPVEGGFVPLNNVFNRI